MLWIYVKKMLFLIVFVFTGFPVLASENSQNDFDELITIDRKTYNVSPDFEIPARIDKDSPVKLNLSDETNELLSIERLIEHDSNSNEMEYHFWIVSAITRANTDLEYHVYERMTVSVSMTDQESNETLIESAPLV